MKSTRNKRLFIFMLFSLILMVSQFKNVIPGETKEMKDTQMEWWREARFGMFIHWGLYAVPAGEWNGETHHAEWIRTTAQIPLDVYDNFRSEFNPVKFDADAWVSLAKAAGMKYIVITSKHHDGFCLFDSKYTDFDVMSTPFKRDIMKELANACRQQGIKICWYHSIMDWHHPDYLPRRGWEKDRPTGQADYNRFVQYLKNQLRELLTNYGEIGVLWFDGEWEDTWSQEYGKDMYQYVRSLQPDIIVNNRVGASRAGMEGFSEEDDSPGDFGTPEQQIPGTGLPGVDWETCMTMNDHWGYNKHDHNWKSTADLIRKLADIASKGGNFLLNVGPTAEGLIPLPSVQRLQAIGKWMEMNGESIYGTNASPFIELKWGRCTQKPARDGTRLYFHVFDAPEDGKLRIPGIFNRAHRAYLLSDPGMKPLNVSRSENDLIIGMPQPVPDTVNTVVVLDIQGKPDITKAPEIIADFDVFVDHTKVRITSEMENVDIRYTLDGTIPSAGSKVVTAPLSLSDNTIVTAGCFRGTKAISGVTQKTFTSVKPYPAAKVAGLAHGLKYAYYEGNWDSVPDFNVLKPVKEGIIQNFDISQRIKTDYFGFTFDGYIYIAQTGIYAFYTASDDGSQLFTSDELVADNDGRHAMQEKRGIIALSKGYHPIHVTFFEKDGGNDLRISYKGPDITKQVIPAELLFH